MLVYQGVITIEIWFFEVILELQQCALILTIVMYTIKIKSD